MLEGFSGGLVSEQFAEHGLRPTFAGRLGEDTREAGRRGFLRWLRREARLLGPASAARTVHDLAGGPIARLLGFDPSVVTTLRGGTLVVSRLGHAPDAPALVTTLWSEPLDAAWREAASTVLALAAPWCFCTNGRVLRLVDARRALARSFVEFDLECAPEDDRTFCVLWGLARRESFDPPALIEQAMRASALETVAVCRSLRHGVLDGLSVLLAAFAGSVRRSSVRAGALEAAHEQALTIVYRVLFLLFAESRGLVPVWHQVYRQSYSVEALRDLAERAGPARGLWAALQAMSRLAHAGCRAGGLRVTPFNGRLFAPAVTPLGEGGAVTDEAARQLVLALSTHPGTPGSGRARIVYRDLGVEQLGAVYESVLDYRPRLVRVGAPVDDRASSSSRLGGRRAISTARGRGPRVDVRVELAPGGGARKATGTFYTPRALTAFLVETSLAPLVANAGPEDVLSLRVLDPAMGSGAFLVAACRYLAAAYEGALLRGGGCHPSDIGEADRRRFRRLVAQRCLFGVDRNPMAVQLARLSLWLCTLAPEHPLTFLDHHLLAGDSLVGASPDDVRRPPAGIGGERRRRACTAECLFDLDGPGPALQSVLPARSRLASTPDDTLADVRNKERTLAAIAGSTSPMAPWRTVADLWCSVPFRPDARRATAGVYFAVADAVFGRRPSLPVGLIEDWLAAARDCAARRRFFHWSIEFPEVFFASDGSPRADAGFDAVVGNPPWDMIRADNESADQEPARAEARLLLRFARTSGHYRCQGNGHGNLFQLFVERAFRLARPGGRLGLVVPWGLAADQGCGPLRRLLFDRCEVDRLVGFHNSHAIFPIHRSVRFLLVAATTGGRTESIRCRLGERDPSVLDALRQPAAHAGEAVSAEVVIPRRLLERLSPADLAVPDLRDPMDLAVLEKLSAAFPALGSRNGWGVEFGRELNATEDRVHFAASGPGLAVLEGKHVEPFVVSRTPEPRRIAQSAAGRLLDRGRTWGRARLAYRDVASATNRLTLIAAIVPANCVTVHTLFCLKTRLTLDDQAFLCGMLNSFVANYLVRQRVTTHVTTAVVSWLPVPRPDAGSAEYRQVVQLVSRLRSSAEPLGDPAYADLQALVARLYGLTLEELGHVLSTFPLLEEQAKRTREAFAALAGSWDLT